MKPIQFFNRYTKQIETEQVYGGAFIQWLYGTTVGSRVSEILAKPFLSKLYGKIQDMPHSANKIEQFIMDYKINMDEYELSSSSSETKQFSSFNQFFIRKFKPNLRSFNNNPKSMGAFAEARYFGFNQVDNELKFPIKGRMLNRTKLLEKEEWANSFINGPILIARLCPVDYHRFHFPFSGRILDSYPLHGKYHSVNPWAVQKIDEVFFGNERYVTIMENSEFGKIAYIEVGAMCVGKIVQSYTMNSSRTFTKGEEKGYFLFGGSTVIAVGEKGRWRVSNDIAKNSEEGRETFIKLGDEIALID